MYIFTDYLILHSYAHLPAGITYHLITKLQYSNCPVSKLKNKQQFLPSGVIYWLDVKITNTVLYKYS